MRDSISTTALIIKRHNYHETDRVVTLITQPWGKVTVIAKGARKLLSSKRGILEPGNTIKGYFVQTNHMPLLTQAQLIEPSYTQTSTLDQLRNLQLALELFDRVLVEEELDEPLYEQILAIRSHVISPGSNRGEIRQQFDTLLTHLGYPSLLQSEHASISDYVAQLTEKPLRSWEFLQPQ